MTLSCFVQSCGHAPDQDYTWVEIPGKSLESVPRAWLVPWQILPLIQEEAFSVALVRGQGRLLLLVTGLHATERKDYQNRRARTDLAVVAADGREERSLRGLAAAALRDGERFRQAVDGAVTFSDASPLGFAVADDLVARLVALGNATGAVAPGDVNRYGKNVDRLRIALAEELDLVALPADLGPLVVVSQFTAPDAFRSAGIWRGLTTLIDQEKRDQVVRWHEWTPSKRAKRADGLAEIVNEGKNFLKGVFRRRADD